MRRPTCGRVGQVTPPGWRGRGAAVEMGERKEKHKNEWGKGK
jgi:hypothetical protein